MVGGLSTKTTGIVLDVARQRGGAMPGIVTLHDHSRFGNDGAMTAVTWTQLPSGLWVMELNGATSLIDCGNVSSLKPTTEITFEAWLRYNKVDSWEALWGTFTGAGDHPRLQKSATNYLSWEELKIGGVNRSLTDASTPLVADTWYVIAITYDGSHMRIYLNATEIAQSALWAGSLTWPDATLYVGADGSGGNNHDGVMALIRIYSYALTPAQIRSRYAATRRLFGV